MGVLWYLCLLNVHLLSCIIIFLVSLLPPSKISRRICSGVPVNGRQPDNISYIIIPYFYSNHLLNSTNQIPLDKTSGVAYSGDSQESSSVISKPESINLICPLASSIIFLLFKSLYVIPLLCSISRANAILLYKVLHGLHLVYL